MKTEALKETVFSLQDSLKDTRRFRGAARLIFKARRAVSRRAGKLMRAYASGKTLGEGEVWLCDNAFFAEEVARAARRRKEPVFCGELALCRALVGASYGVPDEEGMAALYESFCREPRSDAEVRSLCHTLILAYLEALGNIAKRGDLSGAATFICSLRFLSGFDESALTLGFSPLERILRADPAGVYPHMDAPSRRQYRTRIYAAAKRAHSTPEAYAADILKTAQEKKLHIGALLPAPRRLGALFVCGVILVSLSFCALFCALYLRGAGASWAVFGVLIFLFLQSSLALGLDVCEAFFSRLVRPQPLLRLRFERIPPACRTLTVITALICSKEEVDALISRLQECFFASFVPARGETELLFGLLLDPAPCKTALMLKDKALLSYAEREIARCNRECGDFFFLFTRPRRPDGEGGFGGWERKRGALLSLARFLKQRESEIVAFGERRDRLFGVKYVLSLDADTRIGLNQVQEMIGVLAHPVNRPVLSEQDGMRFVSEGIALVQPRIAPTLEAAARTPFCVLQSGAGGVSAYAGAAYDRAQTLFGHGIFCGKGMFELDAYFSVLDEAFPEKRVLSHDLLEGARLSAAAMTDLCFTDEVPSGPRAFDARAHRWCRGDVQALFFSMGRVRGADGKRHKNPISPFYRLMLWDNLRRALLPAALSLLLLCTPFLPRVGARALVLAALLPLFFPCLCEIFSFLFLSRVQPLFRKFSSRVFPGIWNRLLGLLWEISSLFYRAYRNLDAIFRALYRMLVSHRKTLEWNTARHAGREEGFWRTQAQRALSLAVGVFFLVCSASSPVRFVGFLALCHPCASYFLARPFRRTPRGTHLARERLTDYARDMAQFFVDQVGEESAYLPPDHLTVAPVKRLALRTSPTNIGLYFAALLACVDFAFLSEEEAFLRLEKGLSTVEKLPKWRGLLYNWYDLCSLGVLGGGYVSSVDCGNFLVCLTGVRAALEEKKHSYPPFATLIFRIDRILEESSLRSLYQPRRALFSVGFDTESGRMDTSFYDLYMSEARMTSYYAVARGEVGVRHWAALSRPLLSSGGYLGEASFSGTAFEYFMPLLFLPLARGSFDDEALRYAYAKQRAHCVRTAVGEVFGISESAFYALDADGDYHYRACGVPALAIRRDHPKTPVISPYSSFLMLPVAESAVLANLARLKAIGVYGEYGFYESVQFDTPEGSIVKSYMAHHVGMSLIAAANAVFDNVFCRRFLAQGSFAAASALLEARIPVDAVLHRRRIKRQSFVFRPAPAPDKEQYSCGEKAASAFISPGKEALLCVDTDGAVELLLGRKNKACHAARPVLPLRENDGFVVRLNCDGKLFSTIPAENDGDTKTTLRRVCGGFLFRMQSGPMRAQVSFCLSGARQVLQVKTQFFGECKNLTVFLSFAPLLREAKEYESHPAFCELSLCAERQEDALCVRRRARPGEEGAALCVCDLQNEGRGVPDILCGDALIEAGGAQSALLSGETAPFVPGALPSARLLLRRRLAGRATRQSHSFLVSFARTKALAAAQLTEHLRAVEDRVRLRAEQKKSAALFSRAISVSAQCAPDAPFARVLTHRVLRAHDCRFIAGGARSFSREQLYAHGISGDLPIVASKVTGCGEKDLREITKLLSLHKFHAVCGLSCDLVFLCRRESGYLRPLHHALWELISRVDCAYLCGVRGGVFLIDDSEENSALFAAAACAFFPEASARAAQTSEKKGWQTAAYDSGLFFDRNAYGTLIGGAGGSFLPRGFLIEKDRFDPTAAFSHILASRTFGVLLTHRSLGASFETNSRFRRLSAPLTDPFAASAGERLCLSFDGERFDLAASAAKVVYLPACAEYFGSVRGVSYQITVFSHPTLLFRGVRVKLGARDKTLRLAYSFLPVLGERTGTLGAFYTEFSDDTLCLTRAVSELSRPFSCYLYGRGASFRPRTEEECELECQIPAGEGTAVCFYFGARESEQQFSRVMAVLATTPFAVLQRDAARISVPLPAPVLEEKGGMPALCRARLVNFWLPYQTVASRLFARCGLYQPGGAYGFRDQLQDVLLFLDSAPNLCARGILRAAAHQFWEGDAAHWWHNLPDRNGAHAGVRTRCADDYLWLVYTSCAYVKATGDEALLSRQVPYLECRALKESQADLYCPMPFSREKEPLISHLVRAADLFLARGTGKRGLAHMLAGDWNDGFNRLGEGAESVFLSQFGFLCLMRLAPFAEQFGFAEKARRYRDFAQALYRAADASFSGAWYARAYFGDGEAIGADESLNSPCSLDLLPQAFAAFCYLEQEKNLREEETCRRVLQALDAAYHVLYDEDRRIFKLFTPPFGEEGREVGYIKGYAAGVRENGGQYTHAAAWYLLACRRMAPLSETPRIWEERARKIAASLCPSDAAFDAAVRDFYRLEPYVLCGDVWSAPGQEGRGGWNWYTGSAQWFWRFFKEENDAF